MLAKHKTYRLLIPMLIFNGFEQGFVYADYNKVIKSDSNDKEAYYKRGMAKIKTGNVKAACADFELAYELGHKEAESARTEHCGK